MRYLLVAALVIAAGTTADAAGRKTPYWASLNAGEVMMRKGPGRNFPADWLYKRRGLPVRVVKTYAVAHSQWRRIQDPDGTEGWVQANLLSDQRTGLVVGDVRALRERPDAVARVVWKAEPGVVGKIGKCTGGWCNLNVGGRAGFIEINYLFGVLTEEKLP